MNKRGDLLKNVLGLLLAVVGIGIFIFGVVRLYEANKDQEAESARNNLDVLVAKIEALKDGQTSSATLQGFPGAENWVFTGWNTNERDRPQKCLLKSCLCACKGLGALACQEGGFCRNIDRDLSVKSEVTLKIIEPVAQERFEVGEPKKYILFEKGLFEVSVFKNSTSVLLLGNISEVQNRQGPEWQGGV